MHISQGAVCEVEAVAHTLHSYFNVEIQGENDGASPKRARYHCGLLDMNLLNPGDFFDNLPETYVIFITKNDVLGYNLPINHIRRRSNETGEIFEDGQHILYVNSKKQDDTELGRLMHDLHCKEADEMYSNILATRVHQLKETEEGVNQMCQELEEIYNEGVERGEQSGFLRGEQSGELKKASIMTLSVLPVAWWKKASDICVWNMRTVKAMCPTLRSMPLSGSWTSHHRKSFISSNSSSHSLWILP